MSLEPPVFGFLSELPSSPVVYCSYTPTWDRMEWFILPPPNKQKKHSEKYEYNDQKKTDAAFCCCSLGRRGKGDTVRVYNSSPWNDHVISLDV